jgi:protein transport protein SEC31
VSEVALADWRVALAVLCTYAKPDEFAQLCSALGTRLERDGGDRRAAVLCYVCAGDLDRTLALWSRGADSVDGTQSLVEKVRARVIACVAL